MANKFFSILILFLFLMVPSSYALLPDFTDVPSAHVNADAIIYVRAQGIVKGYDNGEFRPERTINRAEFTKIVISAQFDEATIEACDMVDFSDVADDQWFTPYICVAKNKGIIQGYSDNTFRPDQTISFVEASKIIVKTLGLQAGEDEIWYKPFVERLTQESAIPDSVNNFDKQITRGEMAEMIYRLKAKVKTKPSRSYNSLAGFSEEGSVDQKEEEAEQVEQRTKANSEVALSFNGEVLAGEQSPMLAFNKADYEAALKTDKLIVLYFYANWCPLCKDEVKEATYPAFNDWSGNAIVGFRVNFNDNETDDDEKELARQYGVAYQHTKVFVKNNERILKSPETWSKERYEEEINKIIK